MNEQETNKPKWTPYHKVMVWGALVAAILLILGFGCYYFRWMTVGRVVLIASGCCFGVVLLMGLLLYIWTWLVAIYRALTRDSD